MSDQQQLPGTSLTAEQYADLEERGGFEMPPTTYAGKAAQLMAQQYLDSHQEQPMDPRLKSGMPVDHHRAEVREALVKAGFRELRPGDLARAAATVGVEEPVRSAVVRLIAAQVDASPPAPRSADALVTNYRNRK